jgi:uncharacterized phage protein (TIGR01671 family)
MNREIKFRAWDKARNQMREVRDIAWDGHGGIDVAYSCDPMGEYRGGPDTLMQYTGLKDKNGKEIYEGDMVREGRIVMVVKWSGAGWSPFTEVTIPEACEVIGNIYENPDLIK